MVNKDLNEVNKFLDNLPSDPCKMKKPEALCSLCEKLNEDVYAACQERERDGSGLLLDAGGFTGVEDTIDTLAEPGETPEDAPAMVKKVSDTISFEFHRSPPAPEPAVPTAAPAPEPPAPPAPPADAAASPPPPPSEVPAAAEGAPAVPEAATPPEGDIPEKRPEPPTGRIEVRDRSTGLAIEFVPKKKHFKAKPKDALWDDIMGGETLFRTIMDEYIPPPEPEPVEEVEVAIEELAEFPMDGEVVEGEVPFAEGAEPAAEAMDEGEVLDIEVLDIEVIEEEPVPELGPEFAEATGHYDTGNYEFALTSYDALIAEDPNKIDALIGRGRTLRMLSRYEESLAALDSAIEKAPGRTDAAQERDMVLDRMKSADFAHVKDQGDSFFKADKFADALVMYDRAIELAPHDTHVINNKALTLRHLERYEEARETYEETLRIDPEDLKAKKGLEKTTLAIAQLREKPEAPAEEGAPEAPEAPEGEAAPAVEGAEPEAPAPPEDGAPAEKPVAKKKVITPERKAELEAEGVEVVAVDVVTEEAAPSIKLPTGAPLGPGAPLMPATPAGDAKPEEAKKGKEKKGRKARKEKKGKEKKGKVKKGGKTPPPPPAAGEPPTKGKTAKRPPRGRRKAKGRTEIPTLAPIGLEPVRSDAAPETVEPVVAEVEPIEIEAVETIEAPAPVKRPKTKKAVVQKPKLKKAAPRPKRPVPKPEDEAPVEVPVLEVAGPVKSVRPAGKPEPAEKPVWKKKRARPMPKAPRPKPERKAPVLEPAAVEESPAEPVKIEPVEEKSAPKPKMKFKKGAVAKPRPSQPKKSFKRPRPEKPAPAEEPEPLILEKTPVEEKSAPKPKMKFKKGAVAKPRPLKPKKSFKRPRPEKPAPAGEPEPLILEATPVEEKPVQEPEKKVPEFKPEPAAEETVFEPIEEPIQGEVLLEPVADEPTGEKKKKDVLDWGDLEELVAEVSDDEDDLL